ncbi:MerR family transcriptional regulator [Paenibacillus mendelii]|uniref:MerR family transcriptional regulator n=1 Tax=Paenibacillus mendelii TaxID=206163 RepID=A0ABV6JG54_9BACL|nr:MerR family transcriptional regulator [Paenibacillus mendelii]MCQ6557297.1 MerR family transcriptional regulator [Paenibacillus mendelii]
MLYTVKEVSSLTNVTIKTLHHYHKVGLLLPCKISEAGYRLYGTRELERLQQILFYRELDFTLEQIKHLLEGEPERLTILSQQEELLLIRKERLETILLTLGKSMASMERGEPMNHKDMFKGFEGEDEWRDALREQNQYLKQTYEMDEFEVAQADVPELNEQAAEAAAFMKEMAHSLDEGIKHSHEKVRHLIRSHLEFLNEHGHTISAVDFAAQTRFFLNDDFHRQMLESQQTGLAYFLTAAAEAFAAEE